MTKFSELIKQDMQRHFASYKARRIEFDAVH